MDLTDITIASTSGISSILQGGAVFALESDHPQNQYQYQEHTCVSLGTDPLTWRTAVAKDGVEKYANTPATDAGGELDKEASVAKPRNLNLLVEI